MSYVKDENNKLSTNSKETAHLLGKFFVSTFTNEPHGPLEERFYKKSTQPQLNEFVLTELSVKDLLSKIDKTKAMGPDNVHPKLLFALSDNNEFVSAVTALFRKCYELNEIPLIWKTANVIALHKKGSKHECCTRHNYRPISLTCIMCKLYEKLIRNHIIDHVFNQISPRQHGFVQGKSCLSNLLEAVDKINELLSLGENVDIFYLDFQKAFDTVPHYRLLTKLKSFGISDKTLLTIADFLKDRSFQVNVGNNASQNFKVTSGVPQGSVLGPLLFYFI